MLRRFSKRNKPPSDDARESRRLLNKFLEFITSSIWSIPIASFIEQQSIVFDRQQVQTEIYEQIHREYALLIDTLIECFCDDVNSSLQNLTEAIRQLDQESLSIRQRIALEPLAAAQNYNVFVPMMMRKNIELQLQALQMIEFMYGLIPEVLQLEAGESLRNIDKLSPEDTERYVLISVMRQSKEEFDARNNKDTSEFQMIMEQGNSERRRLEDEIRHEELLLRRALTDGSSQTSNNFRTSSTDTPLSMAAMMISQMTATEDEQGTSQSISSTGKKFSEIAIETDSVDSKNMETNTDRPRTVRKISQTLVGSDSFETRSVEIDADRPKTAIRKNSGSSGSRDESRPRTGKKEGTEGDRPKTGKKTRESSVGTDEKEKRSMETSTDRPKTTNKKVQDSSIGIYKQGMETNTDRAVTAKKQRDSAIGTDSNEKRSMETSTDRPKTTSKKVQDSSIGSDKQDMETNTDRAVTAKKLRDSSVGMNVEEKKSAETSTDRPKTTSKKTQDSSVGIDKQNSESKTDRPFTAKKLRESSIGTDSTEKRSMETNTNLPVSAKRLAEPSIGTVPLDKTKNPSRKPSSEDRPVTSKRRSTITTTETVKPAGTRPPSSTRRMSASNNNGEEEARPGSRSRNASRPATKHHSRKDNDNKQEIDERANIRQSSVDKNAPKRTDSVPRSRRGSRDEKPPKHPGPLKEPRSIGDWPEGQRKVSRPESGGMEHGPRRKNLGDVHSHLTDRDRLNSSDVRTRAEYLRQQRDRLLQLKREERIKQINEMSKSSNDRPRTAQAARGILDKKESEEIRREINDKLKAEILTFE